jgi:hypothetical protein
MKAIKIIVEKHNDGYVDYPLALFYNSGERIIQAIRNRGYTNSRPPTRTNAKIGFQI